MNQLHQTKTAELIEVDEGIRLHITWAQKVFQNLVLKTPADPQFSAKESHLLCHFGQWFQSNRVKFKKINPDKTRELEQAHYLVHHHLHNIFAKLGENQHVDEDLVSQYQKSQSELIELLIYFRTHFITQALQYDPLTGLALRYGMVNQFNALHQDVQRNQKILAIALLDLDHFKRVNDQYGHQAGDEVLAHTAQLLRDSLRDTDNIFRFGGEEFLIFLEVENAHVLHEIIDRIFQSLHRNPTRLKTGEAIYITATVGIITARPDETMEKAIERADQAMYLGKQQGRDRAIFA
ncbi:diguanylate cyclase [Acinetobacter sp. BSP-28]|uniref:diguanylate cyclase n=1 Tax=Acinetobacter sp. BSP-28 TaxID=3344661 RepID=UPI0037703E5E